RRREHRKRRYLHGRHSDQHPSVASDCILHRSIPVRVSIMACSLLISKIHPLNHLLPKPKELAGPRHRISRAPPKLDLLVRNPPPNYGEIQNLLILHPWYFLIQNL
ncbi:hypothetical protein LINGRAHAP2_LOCUS5483, partial [Linum grandiflorum]